MIGVRSEKVVYTWRGKRLQDMTREELLEAMEILCHDHLEQQRAMTPPSLRRRESWA